MEKNVIKINGRHYDAHTGERINTAEKAATPVKTAITSVKSRQTAKHLKAHAPVASKLLMRQAVKKPAASHATKHKIKANGSLSVKQLSDFSPIVRVEKRIDRAKQVAKSQHVNHFVSTTSSMYVAPEPASSPYQVPVRITSAQPARQPQTTSELLEAALQAATSHEAEPLPRQKRRLFGRLRTAS